VVHGASSSFHSREASSMGVRSSSTKNWMRKS